MGIERVTSKQLDVGKALVKRLRRGYRRRHKAKQRKWLLALL